MYLHCDWTADLFKVFMCCLCYITFTLTAGITVVPATVYLNRISRYMQMNGILPGILCVERNYTDLRTGQWFDPLLLANRSWDE